MTDYYKELGRIEEEQKNKTILARKRKDRLIDAILSFGEEDRHKVSLCLAVLNDPKRGHELVSRQYNQYSSGAVNMPEKIWVDETPYFSFFDNDQVNKDVSFGVKTHQYVSSTIVAELAEALDDVLAKMWKKNYSDMTQEQFDECFSEHIKALKAAKGG